MTNKKLILLLFQYGRFFEPWGGETAHHPHLEAVGVSVHDLGKRNENEEIGHDQETASEPHKMLLIVEEGKGTGHLLKLIGTVTVKETAIVIENGIGTETEIGKETEKEIEIGTVSVIVTGKRGVLPIQIVLIKKDLPAESLPTLDQAGRGHRVETERQTRGLLLPLRLKRRPK